MHNLLNVALVLDDLLSNDSILHVCESTHHTFGSSHDFLLSKYSNTNKCFEDYKI